MTSAVAISGSISVSSNYCVLCDVLLTERPFIPICTVPVIAPIFDIGTVYVADVLKVQSVYWKLGLICTPEAI